MANWELEKHGVAENTDTGPSYNLWQDCPVLEMGMEPSMGYCHFDDFFGNTAVATNQSGVAVREYYAVTDNGPSISNGSQGSGVYRFGALRVDALNTANEEVGICLGDGAGCAFRLPSTGSDYGKLWFEARFKVSSAADSKGGFALGLFGTAEIVAGTLVDDTCALEAATNFLGFHILDADGDAMLFSHMASGQAETTVLSQAITNTAWWTVGFKYDPSAAAANKIACFINGTEQSTYITATNIAAATFPSVPVTPGLLIKTTANSTYGFELDWWRTAQVRNDTS